MCSVCMESLLSVLTRNMVLFQQLHPALLSHNTHLRKMSANTLHSPLSLHLLLDSIPTSSPLINNSSLINLILAVLRSRALAVRESWISAMEGRIVQEELKKCYRAEGVNHYENCKHLAELYMHSLKEKRVGGWRKIEKTESA